MRCLVAVVAALSACVAAEVPSRMKAAGLIRRAFDLKVHRENFGEFDADVPKPGPTDVIIKVAGSSVTNTDWMWAERHGAWLWQYPRTLGLDVAGTVVAAGAGARRLKVGDAVWAAAYQRQYNPNNLKAEPNLTSGGMVRGDYGAFAEYILLAEDQVGLAPSKLSLVEAGVLPVNALTAFLALHYARGPEPGTGWSALILGGSTGIGHMAVQLAKAMGAGNVTATCPAEHTEFCRGLGADRVLDPSQDDWQKAVQPRSQTLVLDALGRVGTGDTALDYVVNYGVYVTLFSAAAPSFWKKTQRPDVGIAFEDADWYCVGTYYLDEVKKFVEAGKLRGHINATFRLSNVADAIIGTMEGKFPGKVSIVPGHATTAPLVV